MFITEMILRTRAKCPVFSRRVGGTASLEAATTLANLDMALPHAFVVPVNDRADDRPKGNALAQKITETFVVVVAVSNKVSPEDGKGRTAMDTLEIIRRQLFNALLGWEPLQWKTVPAALPPEFADLMPNSRADTITYEGGQFIAMTQGVLWWSFEFQCHYYDAGCKEDIINALANVTFTGGQGVVYEPGFNDSSTSTVNSVTGAEGPINGYTFNPATGIIEADVPDGTTAVVNYTYTQTWAVPHTVYAQYYPDLLAQAGGNPEAITADMFYEASECPPDATIGSYVNPAPPREDPQHVFRKTRFVEDAE